MESVKLGDIITIKNDKHPFLVFAIWENRASVVYNYSLFRISSSFTLPSNIPLNNKDLDKPSYVVIADVRTVPSDLIVKTIGTITKDELKIILAKYKKRL